MSGLDIGSTVVKIGSNIASLTAQRRLGEASLSLSKTFERLSSGLRINTASDDAAGLAIVSSLNSSRRVFTQGVRNLNDGISLLNIADGALEQMRNIATRLKELAEQSANGTYGVKQRKAIDDEAQALSREYFRIERSTTFNGRGLFFADFGQLRLQAGYGGNGGIQAGLGGAIGTGTFQGMTSLAAEDVDTFGVTLGDLNGDGILDLVTTGYDASGRTTVRLGTGNGTFGAASSYVAEDVFSQAVALGDVNNDGVLDLVTAGVDTFNGQATIRLGRGDGTFGASVSYLTERGSYALALGDLNGDGTLDLVTSGYDGALDGSATVRLGRSDGTFGTATSYATESFASRGLALGDLNGDGVLDLITAGDSDANDGYFTVRLGNGNGTFRSATSYTAETRMTSAVSLGDLNGDGILDIVTAGYADGGVGGFATVRLGAGNGTFGAATSYATEDQSKSVQLGDLNGDGFLDLVTGGYGGSQLNIRLGQGNGTFGSVTSYSMGNTNAVALGDLNGDGVLDLATAGYNVTGRANILIANTVDGVSPLLSFKLTSRADSLQALSQFDSVLNRISTQRGIIGAFQSRIGYAGSVLQSTADDYAAAAGRIQEADVASEAANLLRTQILQQAAAAILVQANQQPGLALRLLR